MADGKREKGDIIHLLDYRPERKHVLVGVLVSLFLHGAWIGKTGYEVWKQVRNWRDLLTVEVVDVPASGPARPRVDMIELSKPLYYPPGFFGVDSSQGARRHQQQRREQTARRTPEAQEEQAQQPATSDQQASTQQPDLQAQIQQLQEGVQRARTLNIGPIREQIAKIYQAQQEGRITIGQISVAVGFRVREDGAFTNIHLVESSGVDDVDNAALLIVDELSQLHSFAPLQKTDSVVLRLTIGQEVILRTTVASPSEAEAAQQVSQLNGLLAAARLLSAAQKKTKTVEFLSNIEIKQEGTNIVAIARVPRSEASQFIKKNIGAGS